MPLYITYVLSPLVVCITLLISVNKLTKTRCGQIKYTIIIIIVSACQVVIAYYPFFPFLSDTLKIIFLLFFLFCINMHVSTKRFNDAETDKNDWILLYLAPVATLILFFVHFYLFFGVDRIDQPRTFYLSFLIVMNVIPIFKFAPKKSSINIKDTDVPVDYIDIFGKLYLDNDINIIKIDTHYIYINDFQFSIKQFQNKYIITSYRDIDNEHFFTKFIMENGIRKLGFHYMNTYYEFTDKEYDNLIAKIKALKNVIYIKHPYMVINNVNVMLRKDGTRYGVVLLKSDRKYVIAEINLLEVISEKTENEEYVYYKGIKKEDLIWWVKQLPGQIESRLF